MMTDARDYNKINRTNNYGRYPVTISDTEAPVLAWAREEDIEESALLQLRNVSQLPGLHGLRVMPDVHWGNGATVGSVIAMEQALAPAAVGVDIGCGVNAVKTNLKLEDLTDKDLRELRKRFEKAVPVGNGPGGQHKDTISYESILGAPRGMMTNNFLRRVYDLKAEYLGDKNRSDDEVRDNVYRQLGSLGGGNHFIELTKDSQDYIWITLHSGSRNIGQRLANYHINVAMKDPRNDDLPKHLKELSLFYKETPEMDAYLHDLNWAQEFAMRSRTLMMQMIKRQLVEYMDGPRSFPGIRRPVLFEEEINCHHNYVAEEMIDGKMMIVTRMGAISA
jgi:tRNA-splicing ligase RtcB